MAAKPCAQLRSVEGIQYELVRKKVKQLHLRVRDNGTAMVSIPLTASLEQADRFVLQNAQWIRDTRVKNITKRNKDNADLPDKATALAYFTAMSDKVYPAFAGVLGGQKPVLKVRSMTSRWGVCCTISGLDPAAQYRVTISYDSSRYYLYGLLKVEGIAG